MEQNEIITVNPSDYEELIDFLNYVFKTDFKALLPKLYQDHPEMASRHYAVKENNRFRAALLSCPLGLSVAGRRLESRGIGMVSTHPYDRGKGHMSRLLSRAMEDMRREGVALATLGGQRQRYEHYGFTKLGHTLSFLLEEANIRHTVGKREPIYTFTLLEDRLKATRERCSALYEEQPVHAERTGVNFVQTLHTWDSVPYFILRQGTFAGYLVSNRENSRVKELCLIDESEILDVLADFSVCAGVASLKVSLLPHQKAAIAALDAVCENCNLEQNYNACILDYKAVIEAFMSYKGLYSRLEDGKMVLEVEDNGRFLIRAQDGRVEVTDTELPSDYRFGHLEASRFLFSFQSAFDGSYDHLPSGVASWLPLPFFFPTLDNV